MDGRLGIFKEDFGVPTNCILICDLIETATPDCDSSSASSSSGAMCKPQWQLNSNRLPLIILAGTPYAINMVDANAAASKSTKLPTLTCDIKKLS
jgi:hypothetical protein